MLKRKTSGAWNNVSTLKKKVSGVWSDCSFAKKKVSGVWSNVWMKSLSFSSSSRTAVIDPPNITKLDEPSIYYSFYTVLTSTMSTTYYATAGEEIEIKYNYFINRPNLYQLYTIGNAYITGSTFSNNYSFSLEGGSNGGGSSGTFKTTAATTGFGTLTVTLELGNADNTGSSTNSGYFKIGNITIGGFQVYTCRI